MCYDGLTVLQCIREFDPDVVVMDIGLPGKNGWDVAKEIRGAISGKRPLLIGISGELTGFDYYLMKAAGEPGVRAS